jgi:hypothetical protein
MFLNLRLALLAVNLTIFSSFLCLLPGAQADEVANFEAQRQTIVLKSMDLKNDRERDAFLKIYGPYQKKLIELAEERAVLIDAYSQSRKIDALTPGMAKQILRQALDQDAKRVRLVGDYIAQLENVLPIQKVVRAYQIENRLQALVAVRAAKNIPLAK